MFMLPYVPELSYRVVTGQDCLHPLLARNSHPDVRRLDHRHVVGAVPDGQGVLAQIFLHQQQKCVSKNPCRTEDWCAFLPFFFYLTTYAVYIVRQVVIYYCRQKLRFWALGIS